MTPRKPGPPTAAGPHAGGSARDDTPPAIAAHLPLTPAVFQILLALADGPRHGYAVIVDVRERTGGAIRLGTGTLYTAIKRLLERGWIAETDEPRRRDAVGSERSRRYYRLTELGREVARAEAGRLEQTVEVARSRALLDGRLDGARSR